MIAYIKGELAEAEQGYVVVENNGIGYRIFVSARELEAMPSEGEEVKLHTYFHVKEDLQQLYGFLEKDDLEMFKLLLNVNGIGPKAALGILAALSADDLRFAVLSDDSAFIAKAPGIGPKTAKKLILELKDKMSLEDAFEKRSSHQEAAVSVSQDNRQDAISALAALGYSASDALRAVKGVEITDDMDTEAILKAALKKISFI